MLFSVAATLVLYESPRRVKALLADAHAVLGERRCVVLRELTKKFEEAIPLTLGDHSAFQGEIKGEIVLVIAPPDAKTQDYSDEEVDRLLREQLVRSGVKDAAAAVAEITGIARQSLYKRALSLRE